MAGAKSYDELKAWQKGRELVKAIYAKTHEGIFAKDFGLRNQAERAAVSMMSNIAEGFGRSTRKDFLRYLDIARGSGAELQSLLYVALDIGYITQGEFTQLLALAKEVVSLIAGLSSYLRGLDQQGRKD